MVIPWMRRGGLASSGEHLGVGEGSGSAAEVEVEGVAWVEVGGGAPAGNSGLTRPILGNRSVTGPGAWRRNWPTSGPALPAQAQTTARSFSTVVGAGLRGV